LQWPSQLSSHDAVFLSNFPGNPWEAENWALKFTQPPPSSPPAEPRVFTNKSPANRHFYLVSIMSSREKKLLALLLFAGFVILNFFAFTSYSQAKARFTTDLDSAKSKLQQAISISESSEEYAGEMEWLATHEPEPAAYQDVQTKLQQFAESQARNLGLNIKSQELLPTDESGVYYNRVQVKINLTGKEIDLYKWFDLINDPAAFRTAYQIRMTPNGQDDTLIDCSATLSQWFPPAT
jgi:hypothetical protein